MLKGEGDTPTPYATVFCFALKSLASGANGVLVFRPLILNVSLDGKYLEYVDERNVIMKRSLRGVKISAPRDNPASFTLWFKHSPHPYTHHLFDEGFRDDLVDVIRLCSKPNFTKFKADMLVVHEGYCEMRGITRWYVFLFSLSHSLLL